MHQLNPKALGAAIASFAAAWWLIGMSLSLLTGWFRTTVVFLGSLHPFFSYSWLGMLVIVLEHLVGGFALGFLFASLYNWFVKQSR